MKTVYCREFNNFHIRNSVVAVGVFDGVHLGHQVLIKKTIQRAKRMGAKATVLTFFPHPAHVLKKTKKMSLLLPLEHRLRLIQALGVDLCIVVQFTKKFSDFSAEYFIRQCLVGSLGAKEIFVGKNFHFGKKRQGGSEFLKKMAPCCGLRANIIQPIKRKNITISSSRIRGLIAQGKVEKAQQLLGRYVSVLGRVCHGDKRGNKLGFPTANIRFKEELLPSSGVYLAQIIVRKKVYQGIAYIGTRPSIKRTPKISLEVHIFNFKKDIYDQFVEVKFLKKLRPERKFRNTENLIDAITEDAAHARHCFTLFKNSNLF